MSIKTLFGTGDEIIQNNDLKLQKEDRLLLLCSTTKVDDLTSKKIESLINPELDWDHLVEMANRHRLLPLLYVNLNSICPEKVPEEVLENLKEEFHENARKNLLLTGELVKVMKLLEEKGINAIPYKGPVLAFLIYDNIGYRQFGDIDILIDESDALIVKKILISSGYELYNSINVDDSYYIKFVTEHQFINRNGVIVEVKWKFEGDFFTFPTNPLFLSENLRIMEMSGFEIKNFDTMNHLLILCIHAAKHGWMRLSWIYDISEFLRRENIDWANVVEKAEKLGVKRILFITLLLTSDLYGLEVSKEIVSFMDLDSSAINISLQVKKRIFKEQKEQLNLFEKFFLYLKMRDKLIYGFKDCVNGLTKPGYKDFENLSLPPFFFPLYRLIRPLLLIIRYGRNPI